MLLFNTKTSHLRKRYIAISFLILFLSSGAYSADTTRTQIAPGFVLTQYENPSVPIRFSALKITIARPNVHIRSTLAHNRLGNGSFETTHNMGRRYDEEDYKVMGALNGDYFGISNPNDPYGYVRNLMIKDHEFVVGKHYTRSQFGMDGEGVPFVDMLTFSGEAYLDNDEVVSIDGVNQVRGTHLAILYNRYIGNNTLTNENGVEVLLKKQTDIKTGVPIDFEVKEIEDGVGSMEIPGPEYYVLSAHGNKRGQILENVEVGDIISLKMGTSPGPEDIAQLMGGGPRLITDGEFPSLWHPLEGFAYSHNMSRHPRTAVGITKDQKRVIFLVIDGRQPASRGATMGETAQTIKSLGAWNAVNLDGGGSSTLIVDDEWVHRPTDSNWMRPVANALIAIAEPYEGEEFGEIKISPNEKTVEKGNNFNFEITGFDLWGDVVDINISDINWEIIDLDAAYGRGGFYARGVSEGYIVAHYQEAFTDTAFVSIQEDLSSETEKGHPTQLSLSQNYPNPFNPVTKITYELPVHSHIRLTVYDMIGRPVAELVNKDHTPGSYTITFDASDLSSGTYLYELSAGNRAIRNKMTLIK